MFKIDAPHGFFYLLKAFYAKFYDIKMKSLCNNIKIVIFFCIFAVYYTKIETQ